MSKPNLILLLLGSLFFFTTSVTAAEFSCPEGGAAVQVQYGDIVNCSIESPGDSDVYAIAANDGDFISANVTFTGDTNECEIFQFSLRGFNDKNERLASDSSAVCGGARIEFQTTKTAAHTITVNEAHDTEIGEYQIEFQCISGTCIKQSLLPKQECAATYDGSILEVPYLEFEEKTYRVDFSLISGNPIQLQLNTVDEKQ